MNNFKLFLEAVSPFFELKGFRFIKSKNGFYKSNNDGNIEFIKFSSHKDISVEPVFGISIPKFDKIFTSSSIKSFQTEGTLFCKNDWIKYYYPTDDFVLQHTLLNTQKLYNECILLFHEKNNSLKGILQTLHLGGYDDEFLKIGRKFSNYDNKELDFFLTKILKPANFEERVSYYKNSYKTRIEQIFRETGEDYRHNITVVFLEIDDLVSKIENLDIEKIRGDLKSS